MSYLKLANRNVLFAIQGKAKRHSGKGDDEAFDRLYSFKSHPIEHKKGKKIAVRVISQFGEESMKVITI